MENVCFVMYTEQNKRERYSALRDVHKKESEAGTMYVQKNEERGDCGMLTVVAVVAVVSFSVVVTGLPELAGSL